MHAYFRVSATGRLGNDLRSLHLVDVENLLGSTRFTAHDVTASATAYAAVASVAPHDLVVVSSSHFTAPATWFGWGSARRIVRSGPDGADLALIEILVTENVAARFDRVVIASGDGIFADAAAQLQQAKVAVTVVPSRIAVSPAEARRPRCPLLRINPGIDPGVALRAAF